MPKQKTSSAHYQDYKPPYLKWWEDNFWSDMHVRRMAPTARHYYRALLQAAFFCDARPFLPADDAQLWMIADAESLQEWQKHKDQVLIKFTRFTQDGKELLRNKRLDEEWAALLDNLEHSKNAGLASARARAEKANTRSTPVEQPLNASQRASTKPQPTETETVTETCTVTGTSSKTVTEPETVNGQTAQSQSSSSFADEITATGETAQLLRLFNHLSQRVNNSQTGNPEDFQSLLQDRTYGEIAQMLVWSLAVSNWWPAKMNGSLHFRNSFQKIRTQASSFDSAKLTKLVEKFESEMPSAPIIEEPQIPADIDDDEDFG